MRVACRYAGTLHYLDAATSEWRQLSGRDLLGIWACNVPYMSTSDLAAPEAQFDNGCLEILVWAGTTRWQALRFFLSIEDGSHTTDGVGAPGTTLLKARALRLELERAPRACIHACILSRVWHVHGMYRPGPSASSRCRARPPSPASASSTASSCPSAPSRPCRTRAPRASSARERRQQPMAMPQGRVPSLLLL